MAYQVAPPDPSTTQTAQAAPQSNTIWSDIFGGTNKSGFFGGGQYQANPQNFNLPGYNQSVQAYTNLANQALQGGQSQFSGQQQQLAQNLFGTLNGQTPSVAQQQLQQTTQGNVANAYALAASGRYNPAAARQAADSAGSINQQAAGQGSLLRAQEIQNAQGQLGNVLAQGRGQDISQFQTQNQAAQGYLGQQLTAQQAQQQGQENYEQAQLSGMNNAQQNAVGGKLLNAAASIGGAVATSGLSSALGAATPNAANIQQSYGVNPNTTMINPSALPTYAHGGEVPERAMGDTKCPGCGHMKSECTCWQSRMEAGGQVPGKAKAKGDSLRNDTVRAKLSPGEIVLPRSVTRDEDAPELAKAFVAAIKAKKRRAA